MRAFGCRQGMVMPSFLPVRQLGLRNCTRRIQTRLPRRPYSSQPPRPDARGRSPPKPSAKSAPPSRISLYSRPLMRFLDWYGRQQRLRPLVTELCSMPLIFCVGDLSAQMLGNGDYDPHRSLRAIIVGAVIAIPSYKWLLFLGRYFNYSSAALSTGAKMTVNQLVYAPLFNVYFFAFHALLSGEGATGTIERVKSAVPESIPRSFLYWPLVTAINFTYVRPQSRSAVAGIFIIIWQSYLSWLNSQAGRQETGGMADGDAAELRTGHEDLPLTQQSRVVR